MVRKTFTSKLTASRLGTYVATFLLSSGIAKLGTHPDNRRNEAGKEHGHGHGEESASKLAVVV
jgi:hypothetical protein